MKGSAAFTDLPTDQKLFSPDEATRALPLVTRIVADVAGQAKALNELEIAAREADIRGDGETLEALAKRRDNVMDRVRELSDELEQIGCILKDVHAGLVDFPTLHEGRVVYLCWRVGERSVDHWHEADVGFAGRRPISELIAASAVST
jgi:hypothetical protein